VRLWRLCSPHPSLIALVDTTLVCVFHCQGYNGKGVPGEIFYLHAFWQYNASHSFNPNGSLTFFIIHFLCSSIHLTSGRTSNDGYESYDTTYTHDNKTTPPTLFGKIKKGCDFCEVANLLRYSFDCSRVTVLDRLSHFDKVSVVWFRLEAYLVLRSI